MAYTTKQLNLVAPNVGAGFGGSVWTYVEPATAVATIIAAGYIDDGLDKGLKLGDLVLIAGLTSVTAQVTQIDANGDTTLV